MNFNNKVLQNNHPLIPNANTYICQKKYVSISSQDRDSTKYPSSSFFEIELPQDYLNVQTVRLSQWSFPANYNVFSRENYNLTFLFNFTNVYNPAEHGVEDPLLIAIYACLSLPYDYILEVEPGFYNPSQMATELTNKLNETVTNRLLLFFNNNEEYYYALKLFKGYNDFVSVYNSVTQKLVFGNRNSGFRFPNNAQYYSLSNLIETGACALNFRAVPDFTAWGLPPYIGFSRCPIETTVAESENQYKFYYGNALNYGDNGVWIKPSPYPGAKVNFLLAPLKINFMGPAYFYMELDAQTSLNCIDETYPYNLSSFTTQTNQTNGVVNSAFAKIAVPTTPISQWYDDEMIPYKWFDPPAERIRRLRIKIRYHNGVLVDFGGFDWSILLEFTMLTNQIERNSKITTFCGT